MFSFWDKNNFLNYDLIIIGGGIVGLSTACSVLEQFPNLNVMVLERGLIPTGASTKNAGFAITDLFTEFIDNVKIFGEQKAVEMFDEYLQGRSILERRLGHEGMGFKRNGLYEMQTKSGVITQDQVEKANEILFKKYNTRVFDLIDNEEVIREQYGFNTDKIKSMVVNRLNGTVDTGLMMKNLIRYAIEKGCNYITGATYLDHKTHSTNKKVFVKVKNPIENEQDLVFTTEKIAFCTNGFTERILNKQLNIKPRRGQVIVTKPIPGLKFQGAYDLEVDHGYYFRDYNNRVILGGARQIDEKTENTDKIQVNPKITKQLEKYLKNYFLPKGTQFEIDYSWAGIMAFPLGGRDQSGKGTEAYAPVIKELSPNVYVLARLSGSGVARSSAVGDKLASLMYAQNPKL